MHDLEELKTLVHSLSNKLLVVEKTLEVYSKNLDPNRLSQIGNDALNDAKDYSQKIFDKVSQLIERDIPTPVDGTPLSEWLNVFFSNQKVWEEKLNLKLLIPQNSNTENKYISIEPNQFSLLIEKFIENSAISGASAVEFTIRTTNQMIISINDNGSGEKSDSDELFESLKKEFASFGVQAKFNSIKGIGHALIAIIGLHSK